MTVHGPRGSIAGLVCCFLFTVCSRAADENTEIVAPEVGLKGAQIPEDWKKTVAGDKPFLIYVTAPIRDSQPVPNEVPGQAPSNIISLSACPDEYEPASFSVFAVESLEDVRLLVSDLFGDAGTIPSRAVDVKVVYQFKIPISYQLDLTAPLPRRVRDQQGRLVGHWIRRVDRVEEVVR